MHFKQQNSKCKGPGAEVLACSKKRKGLVAYSEESKGKSSRRCAQRGNGDLLG